VTEPGPKVANKLKSLEDPLFLCIDWIHGGAKDLRLWLMPSEIPDNRSDDRLITKILVVRLVE